MGFALPNGSHVYLAKTYAEAETVTAATNAAETVFTTAEPTKAIAGNVIHITSAWPGLNDVIARVKEASGSSVTVEEINTLNTGNFAPGGGAGSFRVVKEWEELAQITEVTNAGGEQQKIQIQFLSDTTQRDVNTFKTPRTQAYTIAHDSTLPFYDVLREADATQDTLACYMYVPLAKQNRYWSAKAAFSDIPNSAVNTVETVTATLNLQSGMVFYKVIANNAVAVSGVTVDKKTASIAVGAKVKISATVAPANATNKAVKFTTADAKIATVNETTGEVTGVAAGEVDITATTTDGGKKDVSKVTVTA